VAVSAGGGDRDYPVLVGSGALARLPALLQEHVGFQRWAVISDDTVAGLHAGSLLETLSAAGLEARLFTFPAGERSKSRETWTCLTDALLSAGHGRDSGVVAFGGGVTGDLAGFVAATLLRGVPVVQVPTSMVAMIDASVGGKTGVDTPAGKNLVGAFHPPAFVLADPDLLATLPRREMAQGLVEAIKHGLILDADYLARLEGQAAQLLAGDLEAAEDAVLRSVELKARVVGRDEREAGYREILNFGHTLGHALEAASGYRLSHGSAVGLGMILEARLGESLGVTEPGVSRVVTRIVETLGLPHVLAPDTDLERVRAFLGSDKKRREGRVRFVLLRRPGEVVADGGWSRPVPDEAVEGVLRTPSARA
jgi:3-dehydroquinate synthase